uniref:DUF4378 domain-containing protein n=4 Tax=Noccaea caerulescens TaxID=107243 RepID=A0A1J3HQH0_NOCCA
MSKEVEERKSCSNVVAKLMGLETAAPVRRSRSSSPCSLSSVDREFEDGYEIWEPHQKTRKGKCVGSKSGDKEMDLVRRKLMEAKRLVTDDKLHRSKEFQEALEVLSSNKDLFVKFLQESNSLFSLHLSEFQPVPPHPEATRITVLRPSKTVDAQKSTGWFDAGQPTRIVVLKPSPGKAIASSSPLSLFDEAGDAETRQVAKDITHRIRETLSSSSSSSSSCVLSDDYDGSLNRSNNEYLVGNSEIMSPSSRRHSWDCVNRFESPFSSSSFSRVSFSPESSSVYREAKKRLSERWAMMSLNGDTQQQQKHLPKASTALGDMLALSETKVPTRSNQESNKAKQETRRSVSCIGSGLGQAESTSDPLNTLERSKSVPEIRVHGGTSKPQTESRSVKPSWKVPSLFFFKNRKANKEKIDVSMSQLAVPCAAPQQQSISSGEVSALEPPFQDPECCGSTKPWTTQGEEMSLKSNLIDKSPPIGSVARVFSWEDESYTDLAKPGTGLTEDEDWYYFIKTLLTASGFSGSDPLMTRWHSPDSPLDPSSLRDNFANKEVIKRGEQRSNHKLVFDCVNAIITETASRAAHTGLTEGFDMVEHVWSEFKECVAQDSKNSLKEEIMVREEVVGEMWSHNLQVEVNNLGTEIEVMLLQELVEEAVFSLGSYSLKQRTYAFI